MKKTEASLWSAATCPRFWLSGMQVWKASIGRSTSKGETVAGWGIEYSLSMFVVFGGVIAGTWQAFILQSHFRKAWLWVVASVLGWALAAGGALVAERISRSNSLRGIMGGLYT